MNHNPFRLYNSFKKKMECFGFKIVEEKNNGGKNKYSTHLCKYPIYVMTN